MALDDRTNFAKTTITGIASGATSVTLTDPTNFPEPVNGYNCVIWCVSLYANPTDDPNKEIVRVTSGAGATKAITRAQEGTSDVNHNTSGETYAIANVFSAKYLDDIETELDAKANLISPSFTTPNIGSATGSSLDLEGTKLGILTLKNTAATAYTRMLFDGTGTDFAQGVGNASAPIADLQNKFYIYDFTNSKIAMTVTPNTLATKFYGALEATNLSGTNTGDETTLTIKSKLGSATTSTDGYLTATDWNTFNGKQSALSKASGSDVDTGTDDSKYVTSKAIEDSSYIKELVQDTTPQLGGDLDTNEKNISYDAIPSSDNMGIGDITDDIVAGETVAFPNLAYLKSDAKWWKTDADAIATVGLLGLVLESKNADEAVKVLLRGFVRDDDWNWTVGGAIYVSTDGGGLTQTAPSGTDDVIMVVGYATHADRMYFNPSVDKATHT